MPIRLLTLSLLLAGSAAAIAAPGGRMRMMEAGSYVCELPGDASGPVGFRQDGQSFTIRNANTYHTEEGRGNYLLTEDTLTMTTGPKRGQRFHRITDRFLRLIGEDGQDGPLRCVRRVVNNG